MNRRLLILLLLTVATAAVHGRSLYNGFLNYDDAIYVTYNVNVREGFDSDSIGWAFTSTSRSNWHPLTWLSHMLDVELYGLRPAGHHATNVLLHVLNTLLLLSWLAAASGRMWPSALVAALFALHPLHVESVAWIAERKDVLSTLFWMLTMWTYVCYARNRRLWLYALTVLCFAAGLMAKPMLVSVPFVLLLLDVWPLERVAGFPRPDAPVRFHSASPLALVLEKVPFFVLSAASCVVTWTVQRAGGAMDSGSVIPLASRMANAVVAYLIYVYQMVWPAGLAVLYPHPYLPDGEPYGAWRVAAAAAVLVAVTIASLLAARRRFVTFGWLFYLGTLVPVIGIVQVGEQAHADRYTYVPLIGLFVIVAFSGAEVVGRLAIDRRWVRPASAVLCVAVLAALAAASWRQIGFWRDSLTLFQRAQAVAPSYVATIDLGDAHVWRNDPATAKRLYEEALRIRPDGVAAHVGLGKLASDAGRLDEAIAHYSRAAESRSAPVDVFIDLGDTLRRKGELDRAIESYERGLEVGKGRYRALNKLGQALLAAGRRDEAIEAFREALALNPNLPRAHAGIGIAMLEKGDAEEAERSLRQALQLQPNLAIAREALARAQAARGDVDAALINFETAAAARPAWLPPLVGAARLLLDPSRTPSPDDAVRAFRIAERAAELTRRRDPSVLDLLAGAHAANGRYAEAAEVARRALALALRERAGQFEARAPGRPRP